MILGAALAVPSQATARDARINGETELEVLLSEGFIGKAIRVDTVLDRITLHDKTRTVPEKAHDTMRKNKWRERECKKVQKI